jgi:hypothetical protein
MAWLLNIGGKVRGPIDAAGIRALAASGELQPSDLMWRSGMKDWVPARKVKGVFRVTNGSPPSPNTGALIAAECQDPGVEPASAAVDEKSGWPRTCSAVQFAARSAMWLTLTYTTLELLRFDQWMIRLLKAEPGTLDHILGLLCVNTLGVFYLTGKPSAMAIWLWVAVQPIAYLISRGWLPGAPLNRRLRTAASIADSSIRLVGLACWPAYLGKFWHSGIVNVAYGITGLQDDPNAFLRGAFLLVSGAVVLVCPGPRVIVWIGRLAFTGGSTAACALRDWIRGEWSRR